MDEFEVTLGQRTVPAVHGDQTTATAYAGLGARHLLVLGDGAAGPVSSRLAAQVAVSATVSRVRGSIFPDTKEQLQEAFVEAHGAVRRAAIGTHAEGGAGSHLIALVIEPLGVTAARIGGGRAYLLSGHDIHPLFREPTAGHVGDDVTEPEIARWHEPLAAGSRIVVMTESTARAVAVDIDHLGSKGPPQLAATRLVEAARRRGQYEPLAAQVVEISGGGERVGPHPALERLGRGGGSTRTLSADGRWIGNADNASFRSRRARAEAGWVLWFALAILCGAGLALIIHSASDDADAERAAAIIRDTADTLDAVAHIDIAQPEPPPPDVGPSPPPLNDAEAIAALFDRPTPRSAARAMRAYITNRFARDGSEVFDDLEAWILANNDENVVASLLELMKQKDLRKTRRWIEGLLPRLYSVDNGGR